MSSASSSPGCCCCGSADGGASPALATSWGLAWIAVARTGGRFDSDTLVWTAAAAAAVVLLVAVARRATVARTNQPAA